MNITLNKKKPKKNGMIDEKAIQILPQIRIYYVPSMKTVKHKTKLARRARYIKMSSLVFVP